MKTRDIIGRVETSPAVSKTAENPNGLAHEQAEMDVAVAELQEDLVELYKRFMELRDIYARLKLRRGEIAQAQPGADKQVHGARAQQIAEARQSKRPRR